MATLDYKWIAIAAAVLAVSVGCGGEATPSTDSPGGPGEPPAASTSTSLDTTGSERAPEGGAANASLARNANGPELTDTQDWFNSEPTTIGQLIGRDEVVLVDFWTYTCVNCVRTFPFLKEWHRKYNDRGLTILGVHAPEFEFEKDPGNVKAAIERNGIQWPVVQDNDMATWDTFANRYWPAKYLINSNGEVVYQHFGEGEYQETEKQIRDALQAAGHDISDISLGSDQGPERDPDAARMTRELYGGYGRNYSYGGVYAGQEDYYEGPDQLRIYEDDEPHQDDNWYLQGAWINKKEAIVHGRETENLEDYIALKFAARSVNVVIRPERPAPFEVVVEMDGRPLKEEEFGDDVVRDGEGRSIIRVTEPRLYKIVELPGFGEHELKLRSNSKNFAVFAFTFGIYTEGF